MPRAQIVIIGELHDNRVHHDNQARIAAGLAPTALVFEMLTPAQAQAGQDAPRDDMAALDAALGWSETAWPDFEMYFPIFEAAKGAAIYGTALPRAVTRAAVSTGAAQHFTGDAALFGLDQPLSDAEQALRETGQAEAHCNALPETLLPGMVEAQRLRDVTFAATALQALDETGGPVLVITGNGHARTDWGMPRYLRRAAPEISVVAVGQVLAPQDAAPYDYWIVTGHYVPANGDPCTGFKTN